MTLYRSHVLYRAHIPYRGVHVVPVPEEHHAPVSSVPESLWRPPTPSRTKTGKSNTPSIAPAVAPVSPASVSESVQQVSAIAEAPTAFAPRVSTTETSSEEAQALFQLVGERERRARIQPAQESSEAPSVNPFLSAPPLEAELLAQPTGFNDDDEVLQLLLICGEY